MPQAHTPHTRSARLLSVVAAIMLFVSWAPAFCHASDLVRVEEDWMVLVAETDAATTSPQILNVISPHRTLAWTYGMIELNHATFPYFQEGGIQLHGRYGDTQREASSPVAPGQALRFDFDRLEYTVALIREPSAMFIELSNVRSKSWGSLNLATQRQQIAPYTISIDNYSPEESAENSSVIVAAHRVATMCITQTRYIYDDGQIVVDPTLRLTQRYQGLSSEINLDDFSQ